MSEILVNQPVTISDCGRNIDALIWEVMGSGATIEDGGKNCDKYITVRFSSTGEKRVKVTALKYKKKSSSSCENMGNDAKTDEETYVFTVK